MGVICWKPDQDLFSGTQITSYKGTRAQSFGSEISYKNNIYALV